VTDPYVLLIGMLESHEGHMLPDSMRQRLANMWKRSVEKAIIVGWYKDDWGPVHAEAQTASILRAAERGLYDRPD
jgi:hypothetical protein